MFEQKFNDAKDNENLDDEKIVLDKSAFKALASDTRVAILKELDKRRKTMTELSEVLNLAVATVKEHVDQLSKSKLVVVVDEGRKWKYCELTEKGKAVLYPERRKIWVMLASVVFMVFLSFYMTYHDIGYISNGGLLSSDSVESGIARVYTESPDYSEDDDIYPEESQISAVNIDENPEVGILDAQRVDINEIEDSIQEDYGVEQINRQDDEDLDKTVDVAQIEKYEEIAESSQNVPYLRYLTYALTSLSLIALLLFVTVYTKKRKL